MYPLEAARSIRKIAYHSEHYEIISHMLGFVFSLETTSQFHIRQTFHLFA
jgi:hypothetical protein